MVSIVILFVEALEMRPTDRKCLIARAECYHRIGEADKALADANETMKDDNRYVKVSEICVSKFRFLTNVSHEGLAGIQ